MIDAFQTISVTFALDLLVDLEFALLPRLTFTVTLACDKSMPKFSIALVKAVNRLFKKNYK